MTNRRGEGRRFVVAAVAFAFFAAPSFASEGRLVRARVTVEPAAGEFGPRVDALYTVRVTPGTRRIPLRGVGFFGAAFRDVVAVADGVPATVEMDPSTSPAISGVVLLPEGTPSDSILTLALAYEIEGVGRADPDGFDMTVPLLYVDLTPTAAPDSMFVATVRVPPDVFVYDAFPTVPLREIDGVDRRSYVMTLPVLPSMLRLRGGARPPFIGFNGLVDLALGGLLVVLGFFGYRWIRRV